MQLSPSVYSYVVILMLVVIIIVIVTNANNNSTLSVRPEPAVARRSLMSHEHVQLTDAMTLSEGPLLEVIAVSAGSPAVQMDNWDPRVPVLDQGPWGSCTAFSVRYAYMLWALRTTGTLPSEPSVAYWYAQSRMHLSSALLSDIGSTTKSTMWVLATLGTPTETQWPYTAANIFTRPTLSSALLTTTRTSVPQTVTVYSNPANTLVALKAVIQSGKTLLASILVYSSMMKISVFVTGTVPLPNPSRETMMGGHAIAVTGYDDVSQRFKFVNSWGTYDGINGHFTLPYAYLTNSKLAGSFYAF